MAEIILPPEEENEETPQAPELNIDKPTTNSKVITIEFEAKKTNKVSTKDTNQQLYTTDTDAWFEFKETSLEGANGIYSVVFRNRHDGSIFQRTGDVVNGVAYYKIPHQEIRHAGAWRGQIVYTLSNGDTTSREFGYDVKGHILDGKDVREIVVEDFETLMAQLRNMKDNAEVELANLVNTANQNETDRQAFFDDLVEDIDDLQANYQELLDTGVLQTNINTKLEALEEEYAPKLTEVTAQLAQTTSNPLNHGAKGDGVTNDTQAFNEAFSTYKNTIITEKAEPYLLHKFQGVENQRVVGVGKPIINLYHNEELNPSPVLVGLNNNSYYENLHFNSIEEQLQQNRTDLSSRENIYIKKCKFEGFRDGTSPANANAWGIYTKRTKNVIIEQCTFENNTQADIAITGGSEDILIINPKGSNLHISIEPNMSEDPVKRVRVVGGHINRVSIINPSNWKNHIQEVTFENCEIDNLYYRGGDVEFIGCTIKNVTKPSSVFSGKLKLNDSVQQSANLIKDNTFTSIGSNGHYWSLYSGTIEMVSVIRDSEKGRFVRLNPKHKSAVINLIPTEFISVLPHDILIVEMVGSAKYTATSGYRGQTAQARFYDNDDTEISIETLYFKGGDVNEETEHNRTSLFIQVPENATKLKIYIGNGFNTTDTMLDIESISLTKMNKNIVESSKETYTPKVLNPPTTSPGFTTDRFYKGDILYNKNVESGGYLGWVCVEGGNPGIWKGFGLIET